MRREHALGNGRQGGSASSRVKWLLSSHGQRCPCTILLLDLKPSLGSKKGSPGLVQLVLGPAPSGKAGSCQLGQSERGSALPENIPELQVLGPSGPPSTLPWLSFLGLGWQQCTRSMVAQVPPGKRLLSCVVCDLSGDHRGWPPCRWQSQKFKNILFLPTVLCPSTTPQNQTLRGWRLAPSSQGSPREHRD